VWPIYAALCSLANALSLFCAWCDRATLLRCAQRHRLTRSLFRTWFVELFGCTMLVSSRILFCTWYSWASLLRCVHVLTRSLSSARGVVELLFSWCASAHALSLLHVLWSSFYVTWCSLAHVFSSAHDLVQLGFCTDCCWVLFLACCWLAHTDFSVPSAVELFSSRIVGQLTLNILYRVQCFLCVLLLILRALLCTECSRALFFALY
jgi:hypothetical protein